MANDRLPPKTGWSSRITRWSVTALLFLTVTGFGIAYLPFHPGVEWGVLAHTVAGLLLLLPVACYAWRHWVDYRAYRLCDVVLLGYVAVTALLICLVSGLVVTWQGFFGVRMSPVWRGIHLYSTWATLITSLPHVVLVWARIRHRKPSPAAAGLVWRCLAGTGVGLIVIGAVTILYPGPRYANDFPPDYHYLYGRDRPFAPSLALTSTGGAFDAESLAGSDTCGSSGCHVQILKEWKPSAHRYAAMDPLFLKVQSVMAEQNGPESTRYCGGCHDPISLFSGTKNVFVADLTGQHGYKEGVSCLSCHGIRETDLQGNANYVMTQLSAYLWQWHASGPGKLLSDFLIRTYPHEHLKLSKRMYKASEYCAACHKQFIDEEVNRVGWVQLQNQYDNWKASHWFTKGDPRKTIECRECHMPLVPSTDPAGGDATDYNRSANDGRHRSHRFVAANTLVPKLLELEGWEEHVLLTEKWLKGTFEIPEIHDKWRKGPVVQMDLETPDSVAPGDKMPIRVILTANKVGHDFPTGPLDIIQSWVEIHVYDPAGTEIFSSGTRNEKRFIQPGSFMFKAEPVDQYGNLIDRHNLWEMVGVRYRRALFPGYSDSVEYLVDCPATIVRPPGPGRAGPDQGVRVAAVREGADIREFQVPRAESVDRYRVVAKLMYRKVDQFLINFLLGEDSGLTAPVIEMTRARATVKLQPRVSQVQPADATIVAGGSTGRR